MGLAPDCTSAPSSGKDPQLLHALPWCGVFSIQRPDENGGNKDYTTYEDVENDFVAAALHPGAVKPALPRHITVILQPVRDHFVNNKEAKALLDTIKKYKVTK